MNMTDTVVLPETRRRAAEEAVHETGERRTFFDGTEVRIRPAPNPGASFVETDFLLVQTLINERSEAVTTIEHRSKDPAGHTNRWALNVIEPCLPLTHPTALAWAVAHAARFNIPVVFERNEMVD